MQSFSQQTNDYEIHLIQKNSNQSSMQIGQVIIW